MLCTGANSKKDNVNIMYCKHILKKTNRQSMLQMALLLPVSLEGTGTCPLVLSTLPQSRVLWLDKTAGPPYMNVLGWTDYIVAAITEVKS